MLKKSKGAELVEAHSKYYLYILKSPKNHLYIGVTGDLKNGFTDIKLEMEQSLQKGIKSFS